jgi:hypothetical protein
LLLGLFAALAISLFVANSARVSGLGFPLDDAWIHQTYARNLAQHGDWAFNPGEPSAGATSPLWVLLLAPGYWLSIAPYAWTFLLGWLCLWAIGWLGATAFSLLATKHAAYAIWVGLGLLFEYHLVWAAASGMETALFAALCLAALVLALRGNLDWQAGLVAGAATLTRPEGLTLLAPLALAIWVSKEKRPEKIRHALQIAAGFLVLFVPYLIFNWTISGSLWPNTFYAKQAEYAALLERPILTRLLQLWAVPQIGVGIAILPGFVLWLQQALRAKKWAQLAWAAWGLGLLTLFALRLPVTYQHGRYAIPVLPILISLGAAGLVGRIASVRRSRWSRSAAVAWLALIGMLTLAFFYLGAKAYAADVALINSEMVTTARWIEANTPGDAQVAAHDIGALGYFSGRRILDMAGLVSPEVIPFLRNEPRLADELYAWGADYLVTFPNWFPLLSSQAELVYQTSGVGPKQGGENMAVYIWYGTTP